MTILPRGKMIKDHLDAKKLKLPEAFLKMCSTHFSGYLSFEAQSSSGVMCYADGKVIAAQWCSGELILSGRYAVDMLFRTVQQDHCTMGFFRLETSFMPILRQICNGEVVVRGQLMDLVDISRLLARVEDESFNGALRLYAESSVLIFYNDGVANGFFRDGDVQMVTDVDVDTSVVKEQGCRVDIINYADGIDSGESLGINLEKMWLQVWRELNP